MKLLVEVAPGELIDKITILEIKLQNIKDEAKLANVRREYEILMETFRANIEETDDLRVLIDELRAANQKIWDIEDEIRKLERNKDFGDAFVAVARSVYRSNDAARQPSARSTSCSTASSSKRRATPSIRSLCARPAARSIAGSGRHHFSAAVSLSVALSSSAPTKNFVRRSKPLFEDGNSCFGGCRPRNVHSGSHPRPAVRSISRKSPRPSKYARAPSTRCRHSARQPSSSTSKNLPEYAPAALRSRFRRTCLVRL